MPIISNLEREGKTPLLAALQANNVEVVKLFLEYGADPDMAGTI
jgi:ankyrin repeat protein